MKPLFSALAAIALVAACAPARPVAYSAGKIEIAEPFSRPAAAGANGAGFFALTNGNDGPDRLLRVESPVARTVQIHETSTDGGVMRMRELPAGVPLKAGETMVFKPGGKHVMLIGLVQPLKAGDKVPATLVFEKAGRAPVELTVRGGAAAGGMEHHGH